MDGETQQEEGLRKAREEGERHKEIDLRIERSERDLGMLSKQVAVNTTAISEVNNVWLRQLTHVENKVENLNGLVMHEFRGEDGAVKQLAKKVDEQTRRVTDLTPSPGESRRWRREVWALAGVAVLAAIATGIVYLAIGQGHL